MWTMLVKPFNQYIYVNDADLYMYIALCLLHACVFFGIQYTAVIVTENYYVNFRFYYRQKIVSKLAEDCYCTCIVTLLPCRNRFRNYVLNIR